MRRRFAEQNLERNLERERVNTDQSKGYLQIKPKSNITTEEAIAFWNSVFKDTESIKKFTDTITE